MQFGKKDLPNVIALCIAAAVVAAGIVTGHAWAPSEPTASPSSEVVTSCAGDACEVGTTAQPPAAEPQTRTDAGAASETNKPEAASTRPKASRASAATPPSRPRRPSAAPSAVARDELPPLLPPLGVPAATGSASVPRPDVLRLAGVIKGEDAKLALLRRGDERYLVREGDVVDGVYRVTKITDNTVVLRRRSRTQTLRLSQA